MKLFDKIKDLFMDELTEEDEIEVEEESTKIYEEPKDVLPTVMRETIKREEGIKEKKIEAPVVDNNKKKEEEVKENLKTDSVKKFNFPIDFGDEVPKRQERNVNVLEMEAKENAKKTVELYPKKKEEVKEKPKFKATPVISPVYGILDKNYKKDEVKEKTEDVAIMKRPSKKVDFETVRRKAFGNLADEIKDTLMCENCELYKEVKKISALSEDDLLYDMTVDNDKEVTINKAYENYEEFGVAYEVNSNNHKEEPEEVTINDSNIEDKNEEEPLEVVIEKADIQIDPVEDTVEEVAEEKSFSDVTDDILDDILPSREEKKTEKVDEDFFELIDSMYKERVDD